MGRRTKIVCTLGPAVDTKESLRQLIEAGMNVARINCSHGDWPTRLQWIGAIRELSAQVAPVGILVDLQGPKVRIGEIAAGSRSVRRGTRVSIGPGDDADIPFSDADALGKLAVNDVVLLGDGAVDLRLMEARNGGFIALVRSDGTIRSRQGVSALGKSLAGGGMTAKDRDDAFQAIRAGADFIALSYVRAGADVDELRHMITHHDSPVQTCAKIETEEALSAIDEIIARSDILMIARGDLGLHVRLERVPILQKELIRKCAMAGKPVITATQMLESMVNSPRPTRAEASDVANAILDGSDAVMLSAETAIGVHPIAAVKTMSRIASEADRLCDREARRAETLSRLRRVGVTRAIAFAAVEISEQMGAAAILATTTSGQTARWMSQARPKAPVLAVAWSEAVARQLSIVWGVQALVLPRPATTDDAVRNAMMAFRELGKVRTGQQVVVTAGAPPGITDRTNLVTVQSIP